MNPAMPLPRTPANTVHRSAPDSKPHAPGKNAREHLEVPKQAHIAKAITADAMKVLKAGNVTPIVLVFAIGSLKFRMRVGNVVNR